MKKTSTTCTSNISDLLIIIWELITIYYSSSNNYTSEIQPIAKKRKKRAQGTIPKDTNVYVRDQGKTPQRGKPNQAFP